MTLLRSLFVSLPPHPLHRLPRPERGGGRGPHRLRAGGHSPPLRLLDAEDDRPPDHGRRRPPGIAPALGEGREVDPRGGALSLRRARRVRVPRRDRDRARRQGRSPEPHEHGRRPRVPPRLVAGRQGDRVRLRRGRRERDRRARAGRQGRAEVVSRCRAPASTRSSRSRPTASKLVLTDNSLTLWVLDLATGAAKKIASERLYAPARYKELHGTWSPDSRWVAYTLSGPTYIRSAYVYSVDEGNSHPLTDGFSDVSDPVFDAGGKLLFFLASTDAGPQRNWFSLQNQDAQITNAIYVATLKKGTPSPLAKESDEEKGEGKDAKSEDKKEKEKEEDSSKGDKGDGTADSKGGDAKGGGAKSGDVKDGDAKAAAAKPPKKPSPVVIDFDGFDTRIVDLPIHRAAISDLQAGSAGQVYFLRETDGKSSVQRFDLKDRKTETIVPETDRYSRLPRRQEDPLPDEGGLVDRRLLRQEGRREGRPGRQALGRQDQARRVGREGRPARGVAGDLRRGLARQPGLLLRPEDARARLARDEGEVRGVPAVRVLARGPQPAHPVDVLGACRRPPPQHGRRVVSRGAPRAGWAPRRGLRGRKRTLPLPEGLRRVELESRAARASLGAGRRGEGRRVSPRRERQGPARRPRTSTGASRRRPGGSSRSRSDPRPTAKARAR